MTEMEGERCPVGRRFESTDEVLASHRREEAADRARIGRETYEAAGRRALEAGDREAAIKLVEDGYNRIAPFIRGEEEDEEEAER